MVFIQIPPLKMYQDRRRWCMKMTGEWIPRAAKQVVNKKFLSISESRYQAIKLLYPLPAVVYRVKLKGDVSW